MNEIREEAAHHLQKVGRWRFKWAFGSHSTRWFWHRTPGHNWVLRIPRVWISGVRITPLGDTGHIPDERPGSLDAPWMEEPDPLEDTQ
jgi:hypothetical protein